MPSKNNNVIREWGCGGVGDKDGVETGSLGVNGGGVGGRKISQKSLSLIRKRVILS